MVPRSARCTGRLPETQEPARVAPLELREGQEHEEVRRVELRVPRRLAADEGAEPDIASDEGRRLDRQRARPAAGSEGKTRKNPPSFRPEVLLAQPPADRRRGFAAGRQADARASHDVAAVRGIQVAEERGPEDGAGGSVAASSTDTGAGPPQGVSGEAVRPAYVSPPLRAEPTRAPC